MGRWSDTDDTAWWDGNGRKRCEVRGCEGFVTFPDLDSFCMDCLHEREQQRQRNEELYAKAVRRWFGHRPEGDAA